MKPQSLQDAIKAAAAAKRNKVEKGGWKEPEVKTHKMTAEEYESMKRGGRPSVPTPAVAVAAPSITSSSLHNNTSSNGDTMMRQQLEKERQEFAKQKEEILREMRACKQDAKDAIAASTASLQRSVDQLHTKVETLESENRSLREKVRTLNSSSNHSSSSNHHNSSASRFASSADFDWDRLEGRVERMESEHRKLKERIVSGGGGDRSSNTDPDVDRLKLKVDRLESETRTLRDKLSKVDKLEDEVRALRDKLSALSTTAPSSTTTLTSPRNVSSVPVPPKSPSLSKVTYGPTTVSPATPSKATAVAVKAPLITPSPTKSPKRTKSSSSIKGASTSALDSSSSSLNGGGGGTSSTIYSLFSADKIGKYQARDDALKAYLSNPNAPIGMYPRKVLSVENVQGRSLVHFRSKVYIPASLRERTMEWHYETFQSQAKEKLVECCTWPHQERDMSDYIRNHS